MVTLRDGKFDPMTRGKGRPPTPYELSLCVACGLINILFQYYLLYHGGATSFCHAIGYTNVIDMSETQKLLMMLLFVENQLHVDLRNIFIFQSAVFSKYTIGFVCLWVRTFMFAIFSITAYMGYGLLSPYWYALGLIVMLFFQIVEAKGDYDLKQFVLRKKAGETDKKKVCTEKSWSLTRHPNHFAFLQWWPMHALLATSNPWTVLYCIGFLHFWILCIGIPSNEQYMLDTYGKEYADYQSRVPKLYPNLSVRIHFKSKKLA